MTDTNRNQEKREHPRKYERLLVQLNGKDFQIYTNATNIGVGGAFINTLYLLNEGTALNLRLQMPNSEETVDIRGKVVRQVTNSEKEPTLDNIGMAVKFTDLNDKSRALIDQLV